MITENKPLTRGQKAALTLAALVTSTIGAAGSFGTYNNIKAEFGNAATAAGMVAAGEGVTLAIAVLMVAATMLGRPTPAPARAGLWLVPMSASMTGLSVADNVTESVIYGLSPMGMCGAAECLGFIARLVVIHRTGVDPDTDRKNAATVQRLAYHRARSANHPSGWARRWSERAAWRLAKHVGTGDLELTGDLVQVQRERLRESADAALAGMFTMAVAQPAITTGQEAVTAPVTDAVTQVSPEIAEGVTGSVTGVVTLPGSGRDADSAEPDQESVAIPSHDAVTLAQIAAVAGVDVPEPAVKLTDEQLLVVLRWLRHGDTPPLSYRQASPAFRAAGFVGGENRIRAAWGVLLSHEESDR